MSLMDTRLYKKKGLAFTNNEVSRNSRHAETLKARESSRFKRLSMLRNLDEEVVNEDQSIKIMQHEEKKKPPSRLEMLYKWKKEKQIKKELDKKKARKPFYIGKSSSNMSVPSVAQTNVSLNSLGIAKSRLAPVSSTQPSKIANTTKQQTVGTSSQSSRIPNNFKLNGIKPANATRAKGVSSNSKAFGNAAVSSATQSGVKPANVTRANGMSSNSKTFGNTAVSSVTQGPLPRTAKSTKVLDAKSASNARNGIKMTGKPLAVKTQISALPKPTFTKQPDKPVLKTGIPSFPSNSLKGNSAQKMKNQKPVTVPNSKIHEKVAPQLTENVSNKTKENCLKIAPNKLPDGKNGASNSDMRKKREENNKNNIKIHKEEIVPELGSESSSSIFDCDISIIKRTPSFAPANFKFAPPTGLPDFFIDDEAFERIKAKCISRTSTPSKECKKSSSPVIQVACNDSSLIDNVKDVSSNSLVEEKLKKETEVNFPSDTETKVNLPNEKNNELAPVLLDESTDFFLKVDLNKIQNLFAKHKKLTESSPNIEVACNDSSLIDNVEDVSKDSLVGEKLEKETEVNLPHDTENKINVPNEKNNELAPILVDESCDFLLKVDLNKIQKLFAEHKRLQEEDEESNSGNDLLNESKNEEPAKSPEDKSIDSPFNIVDLSDSDNICTKPLELLQLDDEPIKDKDKMVNKKENNQSTKVSEVVCVNLQLQIIDLNEVKKISTNNETEVQQQEELINDKDKLLNKMENSQRTKVSKDARIDSPLKIIDLNKIEKISANNELEILEEEELMNDDLCNQQDQDKYIKKKLGVPQKRASMLKNVPVLNSIAEIAEPEDCTTQTPNVCSKDKQTVTPSRRSQRLQQLVKMEENSVCISAVTPRRSFRLQNNVARKCQFEESVLSPKPKSNLRRSIRLIDLNTPDKEIANSPVAKTNITADFERLTLQEPENINPHACLLDFECSPVPKAKSKKISLLYSPEKVRKSMRKSIRGDLMSFSPSN